MQKIRAHQKLPTVWSEREKLRDKGQFWTPAWVARAMVAFVSETSDFIFDPATGAGAFFSALLDIDESVAKFYGTDVDAKVLTSDVYQNKRSLIELRDFIKNPPAQKFAAIVSNPPYIRHHRLDEQTKRFLKLLCQKITGFTIDGRAGYQVYFLLQALNSLDDNGRLAIILPADVCEGLSAQKVWSWIAEHFCLEAVATFDRAATPFPGVDTNAVIAFITKAKPKDSLWWIRANENDSPDLQEFVQSKFARQDFGGLEIVARDLREAIETGLSRPPRRREKQQFRLADFARIMRGIATGANEFFFLTAAQVEQIRIPPEFLKRAVGKTGDVAGDALTLDNLVELDRANRPTWLLSIDRQTDLPQTILNYLKTGEAANLPDRALIKQRKPWYKMEKRTVPPLLFAYLGRRNIRFIRNAAGVLPLTSFLCVYPFDDNEQAVENLWRALNHADTLQNLQFIGKSYGSGAIKVEPRSLDNLVIPPPLVEKFNLQVNSQTQATLFK